MADNIRLDPFQNLTGIHFPPGNQIVVAFRIRIIYTGAYFEPHSCALADTLETASFGTTWLQDGEYRYHGAPNLNKFDGHPGVVNVMRVKKNRQGGYSEVGDAIESSEVTSIVGLPGDNMGGFSGSQDQYAAAFYIGNGGDVQGASNADNTAGPEANLTWPKATWKEATGSACVDDDGQTVYFDHTKGQTFKQTTQPHFAAYTSASYSGGFKCVGPYIGAEPPLTVGARTYTAIPSPWMEINDFLFDVSNVVVKIGSGASEKTYHADGVFADRQFDLSTLPEIRSGTVYILMTKQEP